MEVKMQGLPYFVAHAPSATEVVKLKKASAEHLAFANGVLEVLSPVAERWGFRRVLTEVEELYTAVVFQDEGRSIKVVASTDYRDAPAYYNIILSRLGDDGEWSNVALWHLMRVIVPDGGGSEYAFPFDLGVVPSLVQAAADLEFYGVGFLRGDFEVFERARVVFLPKG